MYTYSCLLNSYEHFSFHKNTPFYKNTLHKSIEAEKHKITLKLSTKRLSLLINFLKKLPSGHAYSISALASFSCTACM